MGTQQEAAKFTQVQAVPLNYMRNNQGSFEGVVALHSMTNGLIAAVFTSGLLKIVRVSDFSVVEEIDLLEDIEDFQRVVDAKVMTKTCLSVAGQTSIEKTIKLCVAHACEGGRGQGKFWRVCTFDLNFSNVWLPTNDMLIENKENAVDLSSAKITVYCTSIKSFHDSPNISVTEVTYNNKSKDFWFTTWN